MILAKILEEKRAEVRRRQVEAPIQELRARVRDIAPPLDFAKGLRRNAAGAPAVIAEVKKASPSKGLIRSDFDPVAIARSYEVGGAAAISVLTDEKFFQGSLEYLTSVKQVVTLPVLRKDFLIDEYQVVEARAAGADAVLLIVAALEKEKLAELMESAQDLEMRCLVEAHDEREMETALDSGASLIGINNRNLDTFEVDLATTARLAPLAHGRKVVSESGIRSREDLLRLGKMGVDAVLIGEALMRSDDIEAGLREIIG